MVTVSLIKNPFDLKDIEVKRYVQGITIQEIVDQLGFDVVAMHDAEVIEDYTIEAPEGLVLAVNVEAEGLAWLAANWIFVVYAVAIVALALTMGQEPGLPESADSDDGSPTYSLSSRNNRARLGEPKPVVYGKFRTWPDLAALPFTEYENGTDQVLYQLFEVTQGEADISGMRFEDTPLTSFEDYEVEVLKPGERSRLFPSAVDVSAEVQNIDIVDGTFGPYVTSEPGRTVNRLAFDVVAPAGLYGQDRKDGALYQKSASIKFEARDIDAAGAWFELGTETLSGDNRDPIRRTFNYPVDDSRYEVRVTRVTPVDGSIYVTDKLSWTKLRGFLSDETGITTTTRVALKIRSSEQLGNRALSKFNAVCDRKIPTWDSVNGWQAVTSTSNPAWVFADVLRAQYGGNRSDQYIDVPGLAVLADLFTSEGLEFNGVFDTKGTVWDSLNKVASTAFCVPVDKAGVIHMVRDGYEPTPSAMFSSRNIISGSLNIEHVGVLEETSDSVIVEYFDKTEDYRPAEITCALTGSPANNPRKVQYMGVTDRDLAFRLGMYLTAQNQYRREIVTWETGKEGYIPFFGEVVMVSSHLMGVEGTPQQAGEVKWFDGVDHLNITEPVTVDNPYIVFRDFDGAPTDALPVTIINENQIRVPGMNPAWISTESGYERTHYVVGEGSEFRELVKINKIEPVNDEVVKISGFIDDPLVYTAADGLPVPPLGELPGIIDIYPVVSDLQYTLIGTAELPTAILTWESANYDYFIIQFSDDGGQTWFEVGRSNVPSFTHSPQPGVVQYRIAGVNLFRGAWESITVDTDEVAFDVPPAPVNLQLSESFVGPTLKLQWDSATEQHRVVVAGYYDEVVNGTEAEILPFGLRSFTVQVYAIAPNGKQSLTAASLAVSNPAPAQLDNLTVEGVVGSALINFTWPSGTDIEGVSVWSSISEGFTPSAANLAVDKSKDPTIGVPITGGKTYIRVAAVDVWGDSSLNYSGEFEVEGGAITETQIADDSISTPKLQANAVTAAKVNVTELSALSANMGTLTAGLMKTTASATSKRVEIDSNGQYPFWIGQNAKSATNGNVYYDSSSGEFVVRDDVSGFSFKVEPGATYPLEMLNQAGDIGIRYNKNTDTLELNDVKAYGEIEADSLKANTAMVETLNIAGQAVFVSASKMLTTTQSTTSFNTYMSVIDKSISLVDADVDSGVLVNFECSARTENQDITMVVGTFTMQVLRNSTVIHTREVRLSGQAKIAVGVVMLTVLDFPSSGTHNYEIKLKGSGDEQTTIYTRSITLSAGKR